MIWKIIEKASLVVFLLKKFELFDPPTYIHRRLTLPQMSPLLVPRIFKITERASVVELLPQKSNRINSVNN